MKKMLLFVSLTIIGCSNPNKYKIVDSHSDTYFTDSYTSSGNCITFEDEGCGCGEKKRVTICGSFSIVENKNYSKSKIN